MNQDVLLYTMKFDACSREMIGNGVVYQPIWREIHHSKCGMSIEGRPRDRDVNMGISDVQRNNT